MTDYILRLRVLNFFILDPQFFTPHHFNKYTTFYYIILNLNNKRIIYNKIEIY